MRIPKIKDFLKPTITKIVITILIAAFAVFSFGILIVCGDTYPNHDPVICSINGVILLLLSIGGVLILIIDYPISYILGLIWAYSISCIIVFLFKKLRKKLIRKAKG